MNSVARFREISPLWQYFKTIWQFLRVYLAFDNIYNLLWQTLFAFWANFYCCKWPQNEKIILSSGHTADEALSSF